MVTLNRAVAILRGPRAGVGVLEMLDAYGRLAGHHRLEAVRAHLLAMAGDHATALSACRTAARRTTSLPERRYLEARAATSQETGNALPADPLASVSTAAHDPVGHHSSASRATSLSPASCAHRKLGHG